MTANASSARTMTRPFSNAELSSPPLHVAIIMDGNGRWAQARKRPRSFGHREGVEALRRTVKACGELGVRYLTVYGFSTENWDRPAEEVDDLMGLLRRYVDEDLAALDGEGVRIRVIGRRDNLSKDLIQIIERAEQRTANNERFHLTVAFNYGARTEIAEAARRIAEDVRAGALDPDAVTPEVFARYVDTRDLPDPDLVIRTSGEMRLSNFLAWQSAYSELVFLDVLWPDFSREHLEQAIEVFQARDRRFGVLGEGKARGG